MTPRALGGSLSEFLHLLDMFLSMYFGARLLCSYYGDIKDLNSMGIARIDISWGFNRILFLIGEG